MADSHSTAEETSPCFAWYPGDWRGSRHVRNMNWKERGFYRECLDWAWDLNGLPNDEEEIRMTVGAARSDFKQLWPVARKMFTVAEDGRLRNERQEREREKQKIRRQRATAGGAAKASKQPLSSSQAASKQPSSTANDQSQALPSLALVLAPALVQAQVLSTPPPSARSKRPIFSGQRFTVFEWQLDDLTRMLGEHTDAFELDRWFFDLDAQAHANGLVIPQRDNGAWLQAQTLAEARRRGLPIAAAVVPTAGKLTTRLAAAMENIRREAQ